MKYFTLSLEEDSRLYREFMRTQQFRNASRTIERLETEHEGLTPAEVWKEVNDLINYLRGAEVDDRADLVSQMVGNLRRKLKDIERDGELVKERGRDEIDRSLTAILYCLALRLEAASKDQRTNPHDELIDALVNELDHINHPLLPLFYYYINADGLANERKGKCVEVEDPLVVKDTWMYQMKKIVEHYANRMFPHVDMKRRDAYNRFRNAALKDMMFSGLLRQVRNIAGDEHEELNADYNATFIFNIFGMLYKHAFFADIHNWEPLAKAVSRHYDETTLKYCYAKQEYFKYMEAGVKPQFKAMSADQEEHMEELVYGSLKLQS